MRSGNHEAPELVASEVQVATVLFQRCKRLLPTNRCAGEPGSLKELLQESRECDATLSCAHLRRPLRHIGRQFVDRIRHLGLLGWRGGGASAALLWRCCGSLARTAFG